MTAAGPRTWLKAVVRGLCLAAAFAVPGFVSPALADEAAPALDVGMVYVDRELAPELLPASAVFEGGGGAEARDNPVEAALRDGLEEWRERWGGLPDVEIPEGPALRRGDESERVRLLRRRLGLGEEGGFDRELARAVRDYRRAHGLGESAVADQETIRSLNRGPGHYERLILANLHRAAALPDDPGPRWILVDAAAARLWLYEEGEPVDTMRVIVGKESEQTPMLAGLIRYAMVNPYWNIPPDLVRDRVAPVVLEQGTDYLRRRRFEVLSDWTADAEVIDPETVDWREVAGGIRDLRVRQLPGEENMMGEIKFMFPNRFGVYLHDTPDRHLFDEPGRRFSSGCVRLEDARRLARWMFGEMPRAASPDREERVDLREPVPVFITYFTAAPAADGIVFRDDPYGRDAELLARLERGSAGGKENAARR